MRVSIALAHAGVHWPRARNSWRLKGTNVYCPSLAGDYPDLFADGEEIGNVIDIAERRGVVYFGGAFAAASGHVTLWNGSSCHYDDAYWGQLQKYFWEMA